MNAKKNKEKKKKYWQILKILANPRTMKNILDGNARLRTKKESGIFWDVNRERSQRDNELRSINTIAEADIIRTDLLDRDVQ